MNRIACIFVALGLAAAGSTTTLAAQPAQPQLAMMTEAQMDNVTGGGLIDAIIMDNLNNLGVDINAAVTAAVNANVLLNAPVNVSVNVLTALGL
jgi:hypothetical protein